MRWTLQRRSVFRTARLERLRGDARQAHRDGGSRIRPQDARSTLLLREGMARSETFRALVERIEASNVFVYVSVSPFIKSSLAGQLTWMTQAGPYRYLRATLSTDQTSDQAVASLGHELQHAVEVVDDEMVTSEKSAGRPLQADWPAKPRGRHLGVGDHCRPGGGLPGAPRIGGIDRRHRPLQLNGWSIPNIL